MQDGLRVTRVTREHNTKIKKKGKRYDTNSLSRSEIPSRNVGLHQSATKREVHYTTELTGHGGGEVMLNVLRCQLIY